MEWSQHRKIIELTPERPLQRAVPAHFQYLMVEWAPYSDREEGANGGLVHPVESTEGINRDFCMDVIAGALFCCLLTECVLIYCCDVVLCDDICFIALMHGLVF